MPLSVTIPTLGKPKSVKDAVISVLSKEWPLTAKKIYNIIRKTHGLSVSYQAVHKVLAEMVRDGTLAKDGKEYSISPEWIDRNKEFYLKLEAKRKGIGSHCHEELFDRKLTELHFDSLYEYYVKMLDFFTHIAGVPTGSGSIEGPVAAQLYHMYWILAATKKQDEQMRFVFEHSPNSFFICKGDTNTDRLLAKYFESLGVKVKTGVECADVCDIFTGGDFVIQTFFTKELKEDLDRLYANFGNISKSDMLELYDRIYSKKTSIRVVIIKNPELEKQIYEDTTRHFRK